MGPRVATGTAGALVFALQWTRTCGRAAAEDGERSRSTAVRTDRTVVVIGGGVCGLSTALHLTRRGYVVTVVERATVGDPFQASSVNAGFIDVWSSTPSHSVEAALHAPGATLDDVLTAGT